MTINQFLSLSPGDIVRHVNSTQAIRVKSSFGYVVRTGFVVLAEDDKKNEIILKNPPELDLVERHEPKQPINGDINLIRARSAGFVDGYDLGYRKGHKAGLAEIKGLEDDGR